MESADVLIKENFKIEKKLNSSCSIGLASHKIAFKAHNYIKFELEIIDEFITSDKLEIKGVIVPIKYSIIIGLPTMRRHNLTYRYPTIFGNEEKQDELLGKPCDLETSEGDGNLHARRVVTSSTYPQEAIESEEGLEPVSDSEHPVQQDETESPSLEEREGKRFEKLESPVIGGMRRRYQLKEQNFHPISHPSSHSRSTIFQSGKAQKLKPFLRRCCVQKKRMKNFQICDISKRNSVKESKVS